MKIIPYCAYRDRLGGFLNWTEALVTSPNMEEYRQKRNDGETMAVWQSLTYGGGFRCGYCMAVCPAGVDLIGPYIEIRKGYVKAIVKPLQEKVECVYVIPGSEAETSLPGRLPGKSPRPVWPAHRGQTRKWRRSNRPAGKSSSISILAKIP